MSLINKSVKKGYLFSLFRLLKLSFGDDFASINTTVGHVHQLETFCETTLIMARD